MSIVFDILVILLNNIPICISVIFFYELILLINIFSEIPMSARTQEIHAYVGILCRRPMKIQPQSDAFEHQMNGNRPLK